MSANNQIQRSRITDDYVSKVIFGVGQDVLCGKNTSNCDLTFICSDGKVKAHQCIVGSQSTFLRRILLRRHLIEFDVVDWKLSQAYLYGRRLSEDEATIVLPDFKCETVKKMLSLFYLGQTPVNSKLEAKLLNDLWNCLQISSVFLGDLDLTLDTHKVMEEMGFSRDLSTVGLHPQIKPTKRPIEENVESEKKKSKIDKHISTQNRPKLVECSSSKSVIIPTPPDLVIKPADVPKSDESFPQIKTESHVEEKPSLIPFVTGNSSKQVIKPSLGPKSRIKAAVATDPVIKEEHVTHNCEICDFEIVLKLSKCTTKTFVPFYDMSNYVKHIISHSKEDLFGEIPELPYYVCPHAGCDSKMVTRFFLMLHLATVHGEFLPRLDRRLKELRRVRELRHDDITFLSNVRNFVTKSYFFDVSSIPTEPTTLCREADVFAAFENSPRGKKGLRCQVCAKIFQSSSAAVVHLFGDHGQLLYLAPGIPLKDFGMTHVQENSSSEDCRCNYSCPFDGCSFSTFRKSFILSHLGFTHELFKNTDLENLIKGLSLKKLFDKERRKEPDMHGDESEDAQQTRQNFDLSSESSDDNDWDISPTDKTKSKTKEKGGKNNRTNQSSSGENLTQIRILGVASVPGFGEDDVAEKNVNKSDVRVYDVDSD